MADIKDVLNKLDKMDTNIDAINITLAKQHITLEDHTRRSLANEEGLSLAKEEFSSRIKHLESYKDKAIGAIAILGILGTLAMAIKELFL